MDNLGGAFMEPPGCNRWQPVANRVAAKAAKTSQTIALGCDRLPIAAHGKGMSIRLPSC
jgi:hypothetical protein